MTSQLPAFPKLVFTIIEPLSLLGGFLAPILSPSWFIKSQMDFAYTTPTRLTILDSVVAHDATAQLMAQQLGNCYLLLGLLGVFILNTTSELKVVNAYLWALWLGDIGHVGLSLYGYGWDGILAYRSWTANTWGNIWFVVFLFGVRSLYFAGIFDAKAREDLKEEVKVASRTVKSRVEAERAKQA